MRDNEDSSDPRLKWEYEEVNRNFRALADIRFKLLAIIPSLGGVAIYLLSHLSEQPGRSEPGAQFLLALISAFGFLVTFGVTSYDQRNSELYDGLMARAKFLERRLQLTPNPDAISAIDDFRGQFLERPPRAKKLFGLITLGHDNGLAFIYGSVLGAWFFPLVVATLAALGCQPALRFAIGISSSAVMVAAFIAGLWTLDPGRRRPPVGAPPQGAAANAASQGEGDPPFKIART
jgi:hypothetical protein